MLDDESMVRLTTYSPVSLSSKGTPSALLGQVAHSGLLAMS